MSTAISWAQNPDGTPGETWDFTGGCTKCSPGCANCWAIKDIWRMSHHPNPKISERHTGLVCKAEDGSLNWTGEVRCWDERLKIPVENAKRRNHKPTAYFVCSRTDLFHPAVPAEMITAAYDVMGHCSDDRFIILTKRPERIVPVLYGEEGHFYFGGGDYLPNVWHLTTVENQEMADKRIPELLKLRAESPGWPVLGVSIEPMLAGIDLTRITVPLGECGFVTGTVLGSDGTSFSPGGANGIGLDWVIVGGESGKNARPMHPDWVRKVRDDCRAAGVAFYFKQWGEWGDAPIPPSGHFEFERDGNLLAIVHPNGLHITPVNRLQAQIGHWLEERQRTMMRIGKKRAGRLLDSRTWEEFPEVRKR